MKIRHIRRIVHIIQLPPTRVICMGLPVPSVPCVLLCVNIQVCGTHLRHIIEKNGK